MQCFWTTALKLKCLLSRGTKMCFSAKSGIWTLSTQPPPVTPSMRGLKTKPGVSGHSSLGNVFCGFTLCEWKCALDSKILTHVCKSNVPSVVNCQHLTERSVFPFLAGPTTQSASLPFSCHHSLCPLGIFLPVAWAAEQSTVPQTLFLPHSFSFPELLFTSPCLFCKFYCVFLPAFISAVSFAWNVILSL